MSSNLLTGPIPAAFADLFMLAILRVGNNSLSGPIPESTQLQSLGQDDYLPGNDDLCGKPLPRVCAIASNGSTSESNPEQTSYNVVEAYISIPGFSVGFGVGFVSVATAIHLMYFHPQDKKVVPALNFGLFKPPT